MQEKLAFGADAQKISTTTEIQPVTEQLVRGTYLAQLDKTIDLNGDSISIKSREPLTVESSSGKVVIYKTSDQVRHLISPDQVKQLIESGTIAKPTFKAIKPQESSK